jgi:hypothetical protein
MSAPPATPQDINRYIGDVLRRKRSLLDQLHQSDLDAREKRRIADRTEGKCFLSADGSIPARKAIVDTDATVDRTRAEADVAEALTAHLRRMVAHCEDEIDGARTAAASIRAELKALDYGNAS